MWLSEGMVDYNHPKMQQCLHDLADWWVKTGAHIGPRPWVFVALLKETTGFASISIEDFGHPEVQVGKNRFLVSYYRNQPMNAIVAHGTQKCDFLTDIRPIGPDYHRYNIHLGEVNLNRKMFFVRDDWYKKRWKKFKTDHHLDPYQDYSRRVYKEMLWQHGSIDWVLGDKIIHSFEAEGHKKKTVITVDTALGLWESLYLITTRGKI